MSEERLIQPREDRLELFVRGLGFFRGRHQPLVHHGVDAFPDFTFGSVTPTDGLKVEVQVALHLDLVVTIQAVVDEKFGGSVGNR
jgi:hypothetical protein